MGTLRGKIGNPASSSGIDELMGSDDSFEVAKKGQAARVQVGHEDHRGLSIERLLHAGVFLDVAAQRIRGMRHEAAQSLQRLRLSFFNILR